MLLLIAGSWQSSRFGFRCGVRHAGLFYYLDSHSRSPGIALSRTFVELLRNDTQLFLSVSHSLAFFSPPDHTHTIRREFPPYEPKVGTPTFWWGTGLSPIQFSHQTGRFPIPRMLITVFIGNHIRKLFFHSTPKAQTSPILHTALSPAGANLLPHCFEQGGAKTISIRCNRTATCRCTARFTVVFGCRTGILLQQCPI